MRSVLTGLVLAALTLSAPARGADWIRVAAKDQHEHYFDRGKLAIEGEQITYWRRVVFRPPQPTRNGVAGTAMYRERIDCALHTHRTLGYLLYGPEGGVLENVYSPEAPSEPIIPETVGDRFGDTMCALVARERSRNVGRRTADQPTEPRAPEKTGTEKTAAQPDARANERQGDAEAAPVDPEKMNQQQLLAEIARLEERLAQLRAQLATMSAPAPAVREAPPLSLPEPVVLQDDARAPVLPAGTPTP